MDKAIERVYRQAGGRDEVNNFDLTLFNLHSYRKSEELLLPLENEYLELEETIRDEHMRIRSIKSRIIKNEQVIQNLINNVISLKHEFK